MARDTRAVELPAGGRWFDSVCAARFFRYETGALSTRAVELHAGGRWFDSVCAARFFPL